MKYIPSDRFSVSSSDSCADMVSIPGDEKETHVTPYSLQGILSK